MEDHSQAVEAAHKRALAHIGRMTLLVTLCPKLVVALRTVQALRVPLGIDMTGCYDIAQTVKITLSNLVINGKLQLNPVEAEITFIVIPAQAGCLTGTWEDAEESFPEEIEITFVEPLEALILEDEEGCHQYIPRKNNKSQSFNLLKILTDEQIEGIIEAVNNLKGELEC
jgi:hypothetical protein